MPILAEVKSADHHF